VELDYEFIHIFKKPGRPKQVTKEAKQASRLSKEEWKSYFTGHWRFGGARQIGHEAMFPPELPLRLVRMFSFVGDTVLDPFMGSGTTAGAALDLGRNVIGYEINGRFLRTIKRKIGLDGPTVRGLDWLEIVRRPKGVAAGCRVKYAPVIQDARPVTGGAAGGRPKEAGSKVVGITEGCRLRLETGAEVALLGVKVRKPAAVRRYLRQYLVGKNVILAFDGGDVGGRVRRGCGGAAGRPRSEPIEAYVYLKNRIFVNAYLLKSGLATADAAANHRLKQKFLQLSKRTPAR
jgi:hypothetical protein